MPGKVLVTYLFGVKADTPLDLTDTAAVRAWAAELRAKLG
jgi:hypothetical protein